MFRPVGRPAGPGDDMSLFSGPALCHPPSSPEDSDIHQVPPSPPPLSRPRHDVAWPRPGLADRPNTFWSLVRGRGTQIPSSINPPTMSNTKAAPLI